MTKRSAVGNSPRDLDAIAQAYWDAVLEDSPAYATAIGVPGHDDRLSDITPAGRGRWTAQLEKFLERARSIPETSLSPKRG